MVLENAKNIMYKFWYEVLKPMYGENIKLILSDTDSFVYGVYTENSYQDLYNIRQHLDLAGYSKDTILGDFHDNTNRKVPGKFSDEKPLAIIKEAVALKPKMYSLLTRKLKCGKANLKDHVCNEVCLIGHSAIAKGISRTAKEKTTHNEYKDVLLSSGTTQSSFQSIRTLNNSLYSVKITKRGLSAYDDKKFILDNKIETLSYGHYKLR